MTIRTRAPEHTVFGPAVPDSCVGLEVPLKVEDATVGHGRVSDAELVEGGAAIDVQLVVPDLWARLFEAGDALMDFSITRGQS